VFLIRRIPTTSATSASHKAFWTVTWSAIRSMPVRYDGIRHSCRPLERAPRGCSESPIFRLSGYRPVLDQRSRAGNFLFGGEAIARLNPSAAAALTVFIFLNCVAGPPRACSGWLYALAFHSKHEPNFVLSDALVHFVRPRKPALGYGCARRGCDRRHLPRPSGPGHHPHPRRYSRYFCRARLAG
jgi:hypothetical protein